MTNAFKIRKMHMQRNNFIGLTILIITHDVDRFVMMLSLYADFSASHVTGIKRYIENGSSGNKFYFQF